MKYSTYHPKVLLIEPDTILARIYLTALSRAGYTLRVTTEAQSAINIAEEFAPDLVILELQLPAHNGIEFLYEFRSYQEWQHIPVIVQSLVPPQAFRNQADSWEQLGVVKYFYKPRTSLRQLTASLAENLSVGV